jgi:hypothetical protein
VFDTESRRDFARLGFSQRDIDCLHASYLRMSGGAPSVNAEAFFRYLRLPRARFAERVFRALDGRGSGVLSFRDFATGLWTLCSLDDRASLPRFAYTLIDPNGAGGVALEDLVDLLDAAYGPFWMRRPNTGAIFVAARLRLMVRCGTDRARSGDDGGARLAEVMRITDLGAATVDEGATYGLVKPLLSPEEFYAIAEHNASLLFPVFEIAMRLRKTFGGPAFWERLVFERMRAGTVQLWSAMDVLQALSAEKDAHALCVASEQEVALLKRATAQAQLTEGADNFAHKKGTRASTRVEGDPKAVIIFQAPAHLNKPEAAPLAKVLERLRKPRRLVKHRGGGGNEDDAWAAGRRAALRG